MENHSMRSNIWIKDPLSPQQLSEWIFWLVWALASNPIQKIANASK